MIPPGATVGRKRNAIDGTLITKGVVFLLASVPQQQKGRDAYGGQGHWAVGEERSVESAESRVFIQNPVLV